MAEWEQLPKEEIDRIRERLKKQGIYEKYEVRRTDGRDAPGEKHDGCRYFVLDLMHDPHAIPALYAYSESCYKDFPDLARDVFALAGEAAFAMEGGELHSRVLLRRPWPTIRGAAAGQDEESV